jgi:hypothetical protein
MSVPDPLLDFWDRYFRAGDSLARMRVIHRSRGSLLTLTEDTNPAALLRVLEMLLQHARHDTAVARAAAAGLLRDVWVRLPADLRQRLFRDGTVLFLEHAPALAAAEQRAVRSAVRHGCEHAGASALDLLCGELTQHQVRRSLGLPATPGMWRGAATPAPDMEVLRLVAAHAPASTWPRLVADLWRLYNLDLERAESLARGAGLVISGAHARVMLRRASHGTQERLELCWDLADPMLERTLRESRPEDLRTAAPAFFAWLGVLTETGDVARIPLLPLLASWTTPFLLPVLEHWSRATHSAVFRRQVRQALRELRSALGLGPELTPSHPPTGTGHEAAPTPAPTPTVLNKDIQDIQDGNRG